MSIDDLIDRFVDLINLGEREPGNEDEVPVDLRRAPHRSGYWDWQVKRSEGNDWINAVEAKLPQRFPRSFHSLVTRYQFPAFEAGPLLLFANTATGTRMELRHRVFGDMSECLLRNGLV